MQGCPLSPTLFGIYIHNLEECLEDAGCVGCMINSIIINLLLYAGNIILLENSHDDIGNELRILQDLASRCV